MSSSASLSRGLGRLTRRSRLVPGTRSTVSVPWNPCTAGPTPSTHKLGNMGVSDWRAAVFRKKRINRLPPAG